MSNEDSGVFVKIKKNQAYFRVFPYILAIVCKGKARLLLYIASNMSDGNGLQYFWSYLCGMIGSSCAWIGMMSFPDERSNERSNEVNYE